MNPERWQTIKEIFAAAVGRPAGERAAVLAGAADAEIRRAVESLLAAHEKSEDLLARPFVEEYGLAGARPPADLCGTRIDDFLIVEKIGEGGMGTVFLAEHRGEGFTQRVALKLIKRGMDTDSVLKRFLMERQILAQLEHPFIARLIDGGSTRDGLPYFVMEYVAGEDIKTFCERRGLDADERLELFQKICQAVDHAHRKLVVHCDLKPSNIIVTEGGTPKLLDFGIAKLLAPGWNLSSAEATAANQRIMTPEYASPEQLRGRATSVATDVYSLGVVLYELLTGVRPFDLKNKNPAEAAAEIAGGAPPAPSSVVAAPRPASVLRTICRRVRTAESGSKRPPADGFAGAPPAGALKGDLDNIILKAIRCDPAERYASVQELAADLRRHQAGLPVSATADSRRYRFSKFVARHRRAVVAAVAAALLFCAFSGLSVYQGIVATRERNKATERFEKLRDVVRLLMNDTRQSLGKIPGTVGVQKDLAEQSVELLSRFDDETMSDAKFLSEVAEAYEKLGRTQLWNFREFDKARRSVERAVEIRRRIMRLEPEKRRTVEYYSSLAMLVEVDTAIGAHASAIELLDEVIAFHRANAAAEPTRANVSALALALLGKVQVLETYGLRDESRRICEEVAALAPPAGESAAAPAPAAATELAWASMLRGEALYKLGRDEEALAAYRRTAELARGAFEADRAQRAAFSHTSRAHRYLGEIYERRGEYEKALEMYRFSFDWLETNGNAADLSQSNLTYGHFFYAVRCALMLAKLGRRAAADEFLARPYEAYVAMIDADQNPETIIYAREPFIYLTSYYVATGRVERGVELWQRQLERLQKFLDKTPEDLTFIGNQIEAHIKIGDLYADGAGGRAGRPRALAHYERAVEIFRRIHADSAPLPSENETLIATERKIAKLREQPIAKEK